MSYITAAMAEVDMFIETVCPGNRLTVEDLDDFFDCLSCGSDIDYHNRYWNRDVDLNPSDYIDQ